MVCKISTEDVVSLVELSPGAGVGFSKWALMAQTSIKDVSSDHMSPHYALGGGVMGIDLSIDRIVGFSRAGWRTTPQPKHHHYPTPRMPVGWTATVEGPWWSPTW